MGSSCCDFAFTNWSRKIVFPPTYTWGEHHLKCNLLVPCHCALINAHRQGEKRMPISGSRATSNIGHGAMRLRPALGAPHLMKPKSALFTNLSPRRSNQQLQQVQDPGDSQPMSRVDQLHGSSIKPDMTADLDYPSMGTSRPVSKPPIFATQSHHRIPQLANAVAEPILEVR